MAAGIERAHRRTGGSFCALCHETVRSRGRGARGRVPGASALLLLCALLAAALPVGAEPIRVYGIEIEVRDDVERVLVFADEPIELRPLASDAATYVVEIPNSRLDPSTSGAVSGRGRAVQGVRVLARSPVRLEVRRAAGLEPARSSRGAIAALEFQTPGPRRRDRTGAARRRAPDAARTIRLDFRGVPLSQLVRRIAGQTGETFLLDSDLRQRVTLIGPQAVSVDEARSLLDTALLLHGFAAVPMPGGGSKVVPISGGPLPWTEALSADVGDEPVTTLVRLEAIEVEAMLQALQPMLGSQTLGVAHKASNALLLAGSGRRVARLRDAVLALDATGAEQRMIRRLEHADALDVVDQLGTIFDERVVFARRPDERTNSVILRVRADRVADVRRVVSRLDRPATGAGELHVIRVNYADPDDLAGELRAVQSGTVGARSASGVAGRPAMAELDFSIAVDRPTHSLVLRADAETARIVSDLVAELDRPPRRARVVVDVLEVTTSESLDLGFDFFVPLSEPKDPSDLIAAVLSNPSGGGLQNQASADTSLFSSFTRRPLLVPIVGPGGVVTTVPIPRDTYVLTADTRDLVIRTLLSPRMLVASGDEQELFIGDNVPIPVASSDTGTSLQTRLDIERQDTGVRLNIVPTIGEEGRVQLDLELEASAVAPSLAGDPEVVGVTLNKRELRARIHLGHGEVAVLGFASTPSSATVETGTPWLMDIPVLGWLFKATRDRSLETTLMVTVSAELHNEGTEALSEALETELERAALARAPAP